ncbi:MAG: hypothetical protein ABEJ72_03640, partial [Candidatus Aenigmatarchaeota archaeon]
RRKCSNWAMGLKSGSTVNVDIRVVAFLTVIVIGVAVFFFFGGKGRATYPVERFRDNATSYMENLVFAHLSGIQCDPGTYYYREDGGKQVCFPCRDTTACFGYAEVARSSSTFLNPSGSITLEDANLTQKLNFYSFGTARKLECSCTDNSCTCQNGVTASVRDGEVVYISASPEETVRSMASGSCTFNERENIRLTNFECPSLYGRINGNIIKVIEGW